MKLRWLKIRQKLILCQGDFLPIFYLLPIAQSSSPEEFHPQALTEPDVTVSHHPALIDQPQVLRKIAKIKKVVKGVKKGRT
jgi:hypothetical protein